MPLMNHLGEVLEDACNIVNRVQEAHCFVSEGRIHQIVVNVKGNVVYVV